MFKKKQKWFNCGGYELNKRWAKRVDSISPKRIGFFPDTWDFTVTYIGEGPGYASFRFPSSMSIAEVEEMRESLVKWIKEVQS